MNAGTWALLKLDHVWYLRAVHKLSQKNNSKSLRTWFFLFWRTSLAIARRVLTEIKLIFVFHWRFKWRMSGYVNRGWKKCKWNTPWNLQRLKPAKLLGSWFRCLLKVEKNLPCPQWKWKNRGLWIKGNYFWRHLIFHWSMIIARKRNILCSSGTMMSRITGLNHPQWVESMSQRAYDMLHKELPACAVSVLPLVRNWKFTLTAKLVFWRSKQQKTRRFQRFEDIWSVKFVKFLCDCERVYDPQLFFFIAPTKGERTFPLIDCSNEKGALGSCLFGFWCFGAGPNPENQLWRQVLKIWLQVKSHEIYDRIRTNPTPSVEWKAPILQQYAELTFVYFCHVRKTVKSPLFLATSLQRSLILL